MLFKSLFLSFSFGVFCSVFAQTSISELKTPNKSTIDFNFNSVDKTSPTFSNGTIVDKVSYELNSLQKLFPRLFKVSSCEKDSYNTLYCPDALVRADEYWGYDQSEVISKKQTVIDFEQGTYQELTSTVRDFMDGFASTHNSTVTDYQTGTGTQNIGSVIDYQNGSSVSGIGQVVDYANKTTVTECTSSGNMYSNCGGKMGISSAIQYCANLVEGGYSDWRLPTIAETKARISDGIPSCGSPATWTSTTSSQYSPFTQVIWDGSTTLYTQPSNTTIYVRCAR